MRLMKGALSQACSRPVPSCGTKKEISHPPVGDCRAAAMMSGHNLPAGGIM